MQKLLSSGHPSLDTIAKYYFQAEGKHIRPLIVLLISQATNGLAPGFEERRRIEQSGRKQGDDRGRGINDPLDEREDEVLNDCNPSFTPEAALASQSAITATSNNVLPS